MRKAIALLVIIYILIGVSGCALSELVSQAPTATPTPSRTPKPTFTPLPTDTPTPKATATPTDTPTPISTDTPTATTTATNTPVPPPTPTSPPLPPTATPTHTPAPTVYPCSYVEGSREKAAAGKPGEGPPSVAVEGYIEDAAGNRRNGIAVYFEFGTAVPPTECVISGAGTWQLGQFKFERWADEGGKLKETEYYLTIKQSCDPGAPALSTRQPFWYKAWLEGHHKNIRFICSF